LRGCDEKRVLPDAGEPKAIASTELPEGEGTQPIAATGGVAPSV
jgi:hypothetical protein